MAWLVSIQNCTTETNAASVVLVLFKNEKLEGFKIATRQSPSTGTNIARSAVISSFKTADPEGSTETEYNAWISTKILSQTKTAVQRSLGPDLSCRGLNKHIRISATITFNAQDIRDLAFNLSQTECSKDIFAECVRSMSDTTSIKNDRSVTLSRGSAT